MRPHAVPTGEPVQFTAWRSYLDAAKGELSETTAQVRLLEQKKESSESQLSEIEHQAEAAQKNRISMAKARVEKANGVVSNYFANLDNLVFEDFPVATALKTDSDADGKFTVSYPRTKAYAVFVKAEWKSGGENLTYYWLVDAPPNPTSSLNLSNTKMIDADPHRLFETAKELSKQNVNMRVIRSILIFAHLSPKYPSADLIGSARQCHLI